MFLVHIAVVLDGPRLTPDHGICQMFVDWVVVVVVFRVMGLVVRGKRGEWSGVIYALFAKRRDRASESVKANNETEVVIR
jgi:hypothetical protein